jgi:hypothetical protein
LYLSSAGELDIKVTSADTVTEFVMAQTRRGWVASAKAMTPRLRCFLRF